MEDDLPLWKNRYESALVGTGRLIYDWDVVADEVIYGNLTNVLGYSDREIGAGLSGWLELVHPNDKHSFSNDIDHALQTGKIIQVEYQVRKKDGTYIPVRGDGHVFRDESGKSIRMLGFVLDITDRLEMERSQYKQRLFLAAVLDNIQAGIVACDGDGVLSFCNSLGREFLGLSEIQPLPVSPVVLDAFLPDGETVVSPDQEPVRRALNGERFRNVELVMARPAGSARSVLVGGQPILGRDRETMGAVVSIQDITERQRVETALRRNEAMLAEAEGMAHLGSWEYNPANKPSPFFR